MSDTILESPGLSISHVDNTSSESTDSLTPSKVTEKSWLIKKGQVLNSKGRPPGTKNRATIYKEMLETIIRFKDPMTEQKVTRTAIEHVIASQVYEAMNGNTAAQAQVLDRYLGKVDTKVTLAGDGDNPLSIFSKIVHEIVDPQDPIPLIPESEVEMIS
jgi:hypothetical protein